MSFHGELHWLPLVYLDPLILGMRDGSRNGMAVPPAVP
jgi:hypothetical protein